MARETMTVNGVEVSGERVAVVSATESWQEYLLQDGTLLRLRFLIAKILKLDAVGPDGKPGYVWSYTSIADMTVPEQRSGTS